MEYPYQLAKLRPLGRSEQLSAVSHELGFFQNVGISAHYFYTKSSELGLQTLICNALAIVLREHAVLSAIPVDEQSPDVYFGQLPSVDFTRCVFFKTRTQLYSQGEDDSELDDLLEKQHNTDFKSEYGTLPFWRLIILRDPEKESSFTASFIYHHGIGDGVTGLIFHESLLNALGQLDVGSATVDHGLTKFKASTNAELLPPLETLHPLPLNTHPANHRKPGLTEWTGNLIELPSTTYYRSLYLSATSSANFARSCKANGVTVTSGLQAFIAGSMFAVLPPNVAALTGIIPINLRPWLDMPKEAAHTAMGSFIDAIKVQTCRSDYDQNDVSAPALRGLSAALHTSKQIQKYLKENPSPSGEPYTSVAFFKDVPDVAAAFKSMVGTNRDAGFEVSNLGRLERSPDHDHESHWRIGRTTFSRSAVVFGAAITTSVVTGGDGALTIGFSWQKGIVDDEIVKRVVEQLKENFAAESF